MQLTTNPGCAVSASPVAARPGWAQHVPSRMLRIHEVATITGLSRASVYRLAGEGKFPAGVKLSERATGWSSQAVEQWLEERMAGAAQTGGGR